MEKGGKSKVKKEEKDYDDDDFVDTKPKIKQQQSHDDDFEDKPSNKVRLF